MSEPTQDSDQITNSSQGIELNAGRDIDIEVAGDMVAGNKVTNVYHIHQGSTDASPKEPQPRIVHEPEIVAVPAGSFVMGADLADDEGSYESPTHTVEQEAFWIAKYPITYAEYSEFLKRTNQRPPATADWFMQDPVPEKINHPVVNISWEDAQAYCAWLSEYTGQTYRLPTEAQWEKAARGADGLPYPWGSEWNPEACHIHAGETAPVTQYDAFASPYGCVNMLGNVEEWTRTQWGASRKEPTFKYPYTASDGREQEVVTGKTRRVCRGVAYDATAEEARITTRTSALPTSARPSRGFRVVLEL